MFETSGQFWYFLLSVSFGIIMGPIYSGLMGFLAIKNNKVVKNIIFIIFFILLSVSYTYFCFILYFPKLRIYMIIGVFIGFYAYLKSFHFMLAKLYKKVYNLIKRGKHFGRRKT